MTRRTVFRNSEIPGRIHALQPFLSVGKAPDGVRVWSGHSGRAVGMGHLPLKYHASARAAVYVVYSYDTPIAWVLESDDTDCDHPNGFGPHGCPCGASRDGDDVISPDPYTYVVPDVSYSPTTGQHQYQCLEAWEAALRRQGTYRRGPARGRDVVRVPGNAEVYGRTIRARRGGIDGVRPGEVVGRRVSAYEDVGSDASHWSPADRPAQSGYRHPSHP